MLTDKLTHCGLVTPYGAVDMGQHWLRYWLVAPTLSEPMLTYYPLAYKPGWRFLERRLTWLRIASIWQMKYKVAKSPYKTIGENKNKTNWNTYGVIYTKGHYQCWFYRIRKLFSGDVIPLWVFEICKFEITATSPRVKLLNAIDTQMFTLSVITRANVEPGLCCH